MDEDNHIFVFPLLIAIGFMSVIAFPFIYSALFSTVSEEEHTIKAIYSRKHDVMVVVYTGEEMRANYSIASDLKIDNKYMLEIKRSKTLYSEIISVKPQV
jgi:hypothetical protein